MIIWSRSLALAQFIFFCFINVIFAIWTVYVTLIIIRKKYLNSNDNVKLIKLTEIIGYIICIIEHQFSYNTSNEKLNSYFFSFPSHSYIQIFFYILLLWSDLKPWNFVRNLNFTAYSWCIWIVSITAFEGYSHWSSQVHPQQSIKRVNVLIRLVIQLHNTADNEIPI